MRCLVLASIFRYIDQRYMSAVTAIGGPQKKRFGCARIAPYGPYFGVMMALGPL